jgi:RES domain-containing protein
MAAASIVGDPRAGRRDLPPHKPFHGRILIRQVVAEAAATLWVPTVRPYRWSSGFPALYTSLELDVAIAERLKRTGLRRTRLAVGVARATIRRTVDLTADVALSVVGETVQDVSGPDYDVPQRVGRGLFEAGIAALLVPAVITEVAHQYPRFLFVRGGHSEQRRTPSSGTNLVIFPDNLERGDGYPEVDRFVCEILGIAEGRITS